MLAGGGQGAVDVYLGVPFAAPPTGDHRWKPPVAPASWSGTRRADRLPASCRQTVTPEGFGPWTHEYVVGGEVSEDCLYLNVWTPAARGEERLPVMVWIHGGAFSSGSASVPIYDGSALAAKGIVVIAINYRLGVYGFLAHPELAAESPLQASGNYGLLDQIAALKWVAANIAAFGGDPAKITIAGQSAGAASVHHLISTPLAEGLFVRAIAQSGSGMGVPVRERAAAEQIGASLMQAAGVTSLVDLRRLPPDRLDAAAREVAMQNPDALTFAPIIDGFVIPNAQALDAATNDTPILTGMTAREMAGLDPAYGTATPAGLTALLVSTFGSSAGEFAELYPATTDAEANAAVAMIAADRGLAAMADWADRRQLASDRPIYAYLWSHPEPGPDAERYGAFHSSEIPYVFATLDKSPERPFTDLDRRLSAQLGDYWVNWVKRGDPNGPGLPAWPIYTRATRQILEIGVESRVRPILPSAKLTQFQRFIEQGGKVSLF